MKNYLPYVGIDGRLCYGPCCHADRYTCLCRIFREQLRDFGFHPVASQRRRDLVCAVLGYPPGGLVPGTDGEKICFFEHQEGKAFQLRHTMAIEAWARLMTLAADSDYDYQPPICTNS